MSQPAQPTCHGTTKPPHLDSTLSLLRALRSQGRTTNNGHSPRTYTFLLIFSHLFSDFDPLDISRHQTLTHLCRRHLPHGALLFHTSCPSGPSLNLSISCTIACWMHRSECLLVTWAVGRCQPAIRIMKPRTRAAKVGLLSTTGAEAPLSLLDLLAVDPRSR